RPGPRLLSPPPSTTRLHRLLDKRLRVPFPLACGAARAIRASARPRQYRERVRLARALAPGPLDVARSEGFRRLEPGALPGTGPLVERCLEIYRDRRKTHGAGDLLHNPKKGFLLSILSGPDFARQPELVRFMVARPIVEVAARYLGSVPILSGAHLWWSPPNQSARSSQLFHIDREDTEQLKLFVHITRVSEENGPLTLLPAHVSQRVRRRVGLHVRRLQDAQVERAAALSEPIRVTGEPGSAVFVDTSSCLHYGSRANRSDRLVLAIQFLRFHSPRGATLPFQRPPDLARMDLDPLQQLALGVR
ncbi:MAG: hypothetical protein ACE5IL_09865, partial [Myxococcota bacterium]